jgi:type IV secretory pathway protease TraF
MDAVVATKEFKEEMTASARTGWRLCGIGLLVILLYATYGRAERVAGLTFGLAGVAEPDQHVEKGDAVLCHFLRARPEPPPLKQGDLVLIRVPGLIAVHAMHGGGEGGEGTRMSGTYVGDRLGQLIALPGDELALTAEGFTVNGRALDARKFPVSKSLRAAFGPIRLGKDKYFVTMEWQTEGALAGTVAAVPYEACICSRQDVLARGVMRWFPFRKWGYLEELE